MKRLYDGLLGLNDAVFLQIVITWYLVGLGMIAALVEVILTRNVSGLGLNLSTELIGGALIYVLLSVIVGRQLSQDAERRAVEQEKRRLIWQMSSNDNTLAKEAVRILKREGWGFRDDTTLHQVSLRKANLEGVDLSNANFPGVDLCWANLQGASLWRANMELSGLIEVNLEEANLERANLREAYLEAANLKRARLGDTNLQRAYICGADLREANLARANLQGAELVGVNLQGANLMGADLCMVEMGEANLEGTDLTGARFDEGTMLPDSDFWTSDTDMARFTDPVHPDFWRSDDHIFARLPGW